ncbi:MAG: hypothetical protein JXR88_16875 [Clostridia bacterium]|nr:hypothetical protein [Clostridia bacterium]
MMVFKSDFTLSDFEEMCVLEQKYYDKTFVTSAEETYQWYLKDRNTVRACYLDERLMGFMNLIAIDEALYHKIKNGLFNDAALTKQDIKTFDDPISKYLFLSCIVVDEDYIAYGVADALLLNYIQWLDITFKDKFINVITDNVTEKGCRFSASVGLSFFKISDHESFVYSGDYSVFKETVIKRCRRNNLDK